MDYENPKIPEGINVSAVHPLQDFALLISGIAALFFGVLMILYLAADYLAAYIPFTAEHKVAEVVLEKYTQPNQLSEQDQLVENYLIEKVQSIARAQALPTDIKLSVHYLADDTVNAFATIGGHIIIYKGLLEKLPSENALVMVLAHEIAHIRHRDPIRALGRGIMLATAMSVFTGATGSNSVHAVFSQAGLLTSFSFGREQERQADRAALEALLALYGHTQGAEDLFAIFQQELKQEPPEWLSTHPLTQKRIEAIKSYSESLSESPKTTAMPGAVLEVIGSQFQAPSNSSPSR